MMRHQIKESFWILVVLALMHVALGPSITHAQQQATGKHAEQAPGTRTQQAPETHAQQSPGTHAEQAPENGQASSTIRIGPGDLLQITVFDVPEMAQLVRVAADGKVELALIG